MPAAKRLKPKPPTRTPHELARLRIKNWMDATGTKQTQLAQRIGRRQSWLSRYLAGEFETDLNTLVLLASALDRSFTALFEPLPQTPDPRLINLIEIFKALEEIDKVLLIRMAENLMQPRRSDDAGSSGQSALGRPRP